MQLRQRRKQVDDIPQTARLDDQNAFDSSGVDHGFGPLAVTSRRQDGAPAAPAAPGPPRDFRSAAGDRPSRCRRAGDSG